jgi:metallo-beta-lactamase class B
MRARSRLAAGVAIALALAGIVVAGGQSPATVEGHVAAAKAASGADYGALVDRLCTPPAPARPAGATAPAPAQPRPAGPPARDTWYAKPVKVFDNLYFVGQSEYSAWAVTTSEGIVVIDPIFDYSVEAEVVDGLRALGLDPAAIKYVLISHAHYDHVGGAGFLQDRFNARVVMSEADWDLLDRTKAAWRKPKRDMVVATDGQRLTLGDTTLTLHLTPGHTLGTISTLIPVRDGASRHTAAYWGGTAFNWVTNRTGYITPDRPDRFWFDRYIESAARFRQLTRAAGADVILSNHTAFDGSTKKLPAMAVRRAGDPHPYVVGADSVARYLTVAEECAKAGRLRAQ